MSLERQILKCQRCGHQWVPRQTNVRTCPRCKSTRWDKEKKTERGTKK